MKWSHRYFLYFCFIFIFLLFLFSFFLSLCLDGASLLPSCGKFQHTRLSGCQSTQKERDLAARSEGTWLREEKNCAPPSFLLPSLQKSVWSAHAPRRSHGDTSPTLRRNVNTAGCVPLGVVGQLSQGKRLREVGGCAPSICASRRASLSLIVINLLSFAFFASLTPDSSVN